jgi:hypothetical protein
LGINNSGQTVGWYGDTSGFFYTGNSGGSLTSFDDPSATGVCVDRTMTDRTR